MTKISSKSIILAVIAVAVLTGTIVLAATLINNKPNKPLQVRDEMVTETSDDEEQENDNPDDKKSTNKDADTEVASTPTYTAPLFFEPEKPEPQPDPIPVPTPVPDPDPEPTMPEEKMTPGLRTVKNFLATALAPVGKTLWVAGGGWDYDEKGADDTARSIGMSESWIDFFDSKDANYDVEETFSEDSNPYHDKGLDATGYIGWTIYNTLFDESLIDDGFVATPDNMVTLLSDYADFEPAEDLVSKSQVEIASELKPGDFVMMAGPHYYITLGTCEDGNILVSHSTYGTSSTGVRGGSVQISAVVDHNGPEEESNVPEEPTEPEAVEATALAESYMEKYPEWDDRYDAQEKDMNAYMGFYNWWGEANGIFHWKEDVLEDPDGYRDMSAEEIMADLYK